MVTWKVTKIRYGGEVEGLADITVPDIADCDEYSDNQESTNELATNMPSATEIYELIQKNIDINITQTINGASEEITFKAKADLWYLKKVVHGDTPAQDETYEFYFNFKNGYDEDAEYDFYSKQDGIWVVDTYEILGTLKDEAFYYMYIEELYELISKVKSTNGYNNSVFVQDTTDTNKYTCDDVTLKLAHIGSKYDYVTSWNDTSCSTSFEVTTAKFGLIGNSVDDITLPEVNS